MTADKANPTANPRGRSERRLSASLEDYLEAISRVVAEKRAARPKDIAARLGVNSSSVTAALQNLARRNLVNYAPYDLVTLTARGEEVAADIVRRHEALHDFFQNVLAVDESEAEKAACRLEHAISRPILERLTEFVDFVKTCPRGGSEWIQHFRNHCEGAGIPRDCRDCIRRRLAEVAEDASLK